MNIERRAQRIALACTVLYCALFPGSTITVAINAIPPWGEGMGAALLFLQGLAAIAWLTGSYGWRGAATATITFLLAWGVEHIGETTGMPFGQYRYTDMLQPQFFDIVPLPITFAWVMVAVGSWQLSHEIIRSITWFSQSTRSLWSAVITASLVVFLDLQIETVATLVNPYWVWVEIGPYYGVPVQNFIGWWLVGFSMALLMNHLLARRPRIQASLQAERLRQLVHAIPMLMYVLSSCMFTTINLAHGYILAGLLGLLVLGLIVSRIWHVRRSMIRNAWFKPT